MPADLQNPFGPSCCDGGECRTNDNSARPCGCDPGAKWVCTNHRIAWELVGCECYPWDGIHAVECPANKK
jgi:hypothetical protein